MPKSKRTVIRIVNPVTDGSAYTTPRSAQRFVERGIAIWCDHRSIRMVRDQQLSETGRKSLAHQLIRIADDRLIAARRGGMVFWNGTRGENASFPPFCNVQFPQPGRVHTKIPMRLDLAA